MKFFFMDRRMRYRLAEIIKNSSWKDIIHQNPGMGIGTKSVRDGT